MTRLDDIREIVKALREAPNYNAGLGTSTLKDEAADLIDELTAEVEQGQERDKRLMLEVCKLACESVEREKALALVEAEVERLREGQRWIPVSERLPETANSVLIRVAHPGQAMKGFTDIACYSRDKKHPQFSGWYFNDREKVESDVTHWMPLPSAPEGEKENV